MIVLDRLAAQLSWQFDFAKMVDNEIKFMRDVDDGSYADTNIQIAEELEAQAAKLRKSSAAMLRRQAKKALK